MFQTCLLHPVVFDEYWSSSLNYLPPFLLTFCDFGKRNKTPAETFPKFPSIIHVTTQPEGLKVTLVAVIGGPLSDLSITRKTDGNFGHVSAGVLFSKVAYQRKRWQIMLIINIGLIFYFVAETNNLSIFSLT